MKTAVDVTQMVGFSQALRDGPKVLTKQLAKGFQEIGQHDIKTLKASLPGQLTIRAKGLEKSFKFKATDQAHATGIEKLFVSEYTGWKASQIFQTGGRVTGKGQKLTILTEGGRTAGGRRKYTRQRMLSMIASGKIRFVPTPRGVLIVESKGGLTKTGKMRKGSADIILGFLKQSIQQKKRLRFFENFDQNESMHIDILETSIENALVEIASSKTGGK